MRITPAKNLFSIAAVPVVVVICSVFMLLIGSPAAPGEIAGKPAYPAAKKGEVVDTYHGTAIPDPYRWLEDADGPDTVEWVKRQNSLTAGYLDAFPGREMIKKRLMELADYPRYSVPEIEGGRYFYFRNTGLQNQSVLYMASEPASPGVCVLDPNTFSADGTVSLAGHRFSGDGKLMIYGISRSGSDWRELRVRDLDRSRDYDDVIKWSRGGGMAWKPDNSGFYYSRYPEPGTVRKEDETMFNRVYFHRLNTPQSQDQLVFEMPEKKELSFSPYVTEDGAYLLLFVYRGTDRRNRVYYRAIDSDGPFIRLLDGADANYRFIHNVGSTFYFRTDLEAPRGRIIAIDLEKPDREEWKQVVAEGEDAITTVALVQDTLVLCYLHDAHSVLKLHDLKGVGTGEIDLPCPGTIFSLSGKREESRFFFGFTSFLYPTTVFQYDLRTRRLSALRDPAISFDASKYQTGLFFSRSKDGTRVPLFITSRRGLPRDGTNPVILYGYGGFSYNMTPFFSTSTLAWLEQGGVYALAVLRGGAEYGEKWHRDGMRGKKQNVFDDFIAAGEYLVEEKYTSPSKMAIHGGSNGGLLVAACMVQRPDLFGAVICEVPLTDMLRYHRFTVGHYWESEYGNAEKNAEDFRILRAYSPLHTLKEGVRYPPTLIMTADHDDRVVASHAKKFAAALQAADSGPGPLLLRVETKAGHGEGKPLTKVIDEQVDMYSFLFRVFQMKFRDPDRSGTGAPAK